MSLPLAFHGHGLMRPECVLAHQSGLLVTADWQGAGGVAFTDAASGEVTRLLAADPTADLKPNGILLEDGAILLTRLGDISGGVVRLHPDGSHDEVVRKVEGEPLPPTNFVARDGDGRLWITVSTRHVPRHLAANDTTADGFIVMVPPGGSPRIVADGLGYTNECLPLDGVLLANETFGRRTSRFAILPDGSLGPKETVATYGEGTFPDGLTPDAEGGLWVTSIISNRVLRLRDGVVETILEDVEPERVAAVEAHYRAGTLDRALLDAPHWGRLKNVSSLAFGGPGLRTAYLGCLLGDAIASFEPGVAGAPPPHYDADLTPFADAGVLPRPLVERL